MSALASDTLVESECRELRVIHVAENGTPVTVAGRITGPTGAPVIGILGGISSGRNVCDGDAEAGWWRDFAGPGKPVDTDRYRVLSFDFIGTGIHPYPSSRDQARAFLTLADAAGVDRFAIIGSSYGGMVALALCTLAPARIDRALIISAAHRASAMAQAWRSIQRDTVEFALAQGQGAAGLDLARRLAMTTYRTPSEMEARFFNPAPDSRDADGIAAYLRARGADYVERETPERFLALSRSMDAHNVDTAQIECPVVYVAVAEDRLVPVDQIAEAAGRTPNGRLELIRSFYGHDAFLKEETAIRDQLQKFLEA